MFKTLEVPREPQKEKLCTSGTLYSLLASGCATVLFPAGIPAGSLEKEADYTLQFTTTKKSANLMFQTWKILSLVSGLYLHKTKVIINLSSHIQTMAYN